jgi:hypothetical protein
MNRLPLRAAVALFEHLTGPVADNPHRLGNSWTHHSMTFGAQDAVNTVRSTRSTTTAW